MAKRCCNSKKSPTADTSSAELLSRVVSSKTKVKTSCCSPDKRSEPCGCNGNASPLHKSNIYRSKQIYQIIKDECGC